MCSDLDLYQPLIICGLLALEPVILLCLMAIFKLEKESPLVLEQKLQNCENSSQNRVVCCMLICFFEIWLNLGSYTSLFPGETRNLEKAL